MKNNVKQKYSEDEVVESFRKKQDIKIMGNEILLLNGHDVKHPKKHDLGNNSWGKIDFLCNYKGYRKVYVSQFPKQ